MWCVVIIIWLIDTNKHIILAANTKLMNLFSPWWCFAPPGVSSSHGSHKVIKLCPHSNNLVKRGKVLIVISILQMLGTL